MTRIDWLILIGGALLIALIASTASAECNLCQTYVCDLKINGVRVSWPPGILSEQECELMKGELEDKDNTEADIKCECELGDRT